LAVTVSLSNSLAYPCLTANLIKVLFAQLGFEKCPPIAGLPHCSRLAIALIRLSRDREARRQRRSTADSLHFIIKSLAYVHFRFLSDPNFSRFVQSPEFEGSVSSLFRVDFKPD
jgi:hypothetical protein